MWIELNEWYYRGNGEWGTRKVMICVDDISCIMDKVMGEHDRYCVRVCLKTGRYHDVKESYEEVKKMIRMCHVDDMEADDGR